MGLAEASHASLERVLLEQRERAQLRTHGFSPLRKLLLLGPPGTGKTMTGGVLASELSLPLFAIQLDGLITKFMGETASKLRLIFDAIEQTRAVYLFDEFDALGSQRGLPNEVGEIRRVLNSFLQFLEQDESDSLIVAATNHAELLDRALYRRFDIVIEYDLPTPDVAERVMRNKLALLSTDGVDWAEATWAADKLSHGDLARACEQAAKDAILAHSMSISTGGLAGALQARVHASR
jgi:SpoVK/Ycf46/Vps4 family AAA+-type ATPase